MTYLNMFKSGLLDILSSQCPATFISKEQTPYRLPYTGYFPLIDELLCPLVTTFQIAFKDEAAYTFLSYFFSSGLPLFLFQIFESTRRGSHILVTFPAFFGLLGQVTTFGVMLPLYYFAFFLTNGAKPHVASIHLDKASAEATLFGVIVGAVIPSACFMLLNDPQVTAIWQIFPAYVSLAYTAHSFIRPSSKYSTSGYKVVRGAYIAAFILGSSSHLAIIAPMLKDLNDLSTLKKIFIPAFPYLTPGTPVPELILQFFKLNFYFTFGAALITSLFFSDGLIGFLSFVLWYAISIPLFGPGAAIVGITLWRESNLRQHYDEVGRPKKEN